MDLCVIKISFIFSTFVIILISFEFNPTGRIVQQGYSLSQKLFQMKLDLLYELQKQVHQTNEFHRSYYENIRNELIKKLKNLIVIVF